MPGFAVAVVRQVANDRYPSDKILILDFGAQYHAADRAASASSAFLRSLGRDHDPAEVAAFGAKGIIFRGPEQPLPDSPRAPREVFDAGVPILGICYECRLCRADGRQVEAAIIANSATPKRAHRGVRAA